MIDEYVHAGRIGLDYKTTDCKDLVSFYNLGVNRYEYHIQGAWYMLVAELELFAFVGLPKKPGVKGSFVWAMNRGDDLWKKAIEEIHYRAYYYNVFFPSDAA
jgi:hypothetical protein